MSHRVHKQQSNLSDGAYVLVCQTECETEGKGGVTRPDFANVYNKEHAPQSGRDFDSRLSHQSTTRGGSGNFSHINIEEYTILQNVVDSTAFQAFVVFLTLANGIVIGLETDCAQIFRWGYVEKVFIVLFSIEMILKIVAIGPRHYFSIHNSEVAWNVFDVVIVSAGVADVFGTIMFGDFQSGGFSTIMRMFRLLRVLRLLRIMRYLKNLYLLAFGLIEATKAVGWVTLLMTFVIYICSIVLVHTVGRLPPEASGSDFLTRRFGTVQKAMLTLFQFMNSPILNEYEDGIMDHYPFLIGFLVVWIIFGSFGMVAMLTGVISESIFEKNQMWIEEVRNEKEEMHRTIKAWCRQAFNEVPHDLHGEASKNDIKALLPSCKELCEQLGVHFTYHELKKSVKYMDHSNSGGINYHEFAHGIMNVLEGESKVGLQEMRQTLRVTCLHVERMLDYIRKIHGHQQEQVQGASSKEQDSMTAREGQIDERVLSLVQRVEDVCNVVRQMADKQRDCIRDVSELAVAMGTTLQTMSDFANDVRQNGWGEPPKETAAVKEFENKGPPKELWDKILKGFHETLMAELSAKMAIIDQALVSFQDQHDLPFDAGGRYQLPQVPGSVVDNLPRTIAAIKAEILSAATSTIVAERSMISDLISQMRPLIGSPNLLAVDAGVSACSRNHGSDGETGGLKVQSSHQ